MSAARDPTPESDHFARLRGALVHSLAKPAREEAIEYLRELHRLGAPRLWEAARITRALHVRSRIRPDLDPRAERWLVRLVARIAIKDELDLAGLDELFSIAERYADDDDAQDAIERYCRQPPPSPNSRSE